MKIILKVKGVDDFGRESIEARVDRYSQHYPAMDVNDIIVYYYPPMSKGNRNLVIRVCQVTKITETYSKDGFYYEEGLMKKINPDGGDINQWLIDLYKKHPETSKRIAELINIAIKKHNPELIAA